MKKIITLLQPFDLKQIVIAYENGNKIDAAEIETADIANGICKMAKSLDINEINLGGAKQYARGIGKQIQEKAATEYEINDIKIIYI